MTSVTGLWMLKTYLDFLTEEIKQNPSKLIFPDRAQEEEVDRLLEGNNYDREIKDR